MHNQEYRVGTLKGAEPPKMSNAELTECRQRAAKYETNFQRHFGTAEKTADILLPLMPTMEGFCPYCPHWKDSACKVNPEWDCKPGIIGWLNAPAQDMGILEEEKGNA